MPLNELEIRAGEPLARNIKDMFFPEREWGVPVAWMVGEMIGKLKARGRKLFPDMEMKEILRTFETFNKEDLMEVLDENKVQAETTHGNGVRGARNVHEVASSGVPACVRNDVRRTEWEDICSGRLQI